MISCLDKINSYVPGIETTKKKMKHIYFSEKLSEKLNDYRYSQRIRSESLASQRLVFHALKDLGYITKDADEQDFI